MATKKSTNSKYVWKSGDVVWDKPVKKSQKSSKKRSK